MTRVTKLCICLHLNFNYYETDSKLKRLSCALQEIMVKGDTARKQMPGFEERKFKKGENVVGFI